MRERFLFPALLCCFFFSGATALVYEVLWVRLFVLRIGSTALAVSTVVTAFMAGLALGAWLAGRFCRRVARPLFVYAVLELGIASSALLVPLALAGLEPVFQLIWQHFQLRFLTFSLLQFYFALLLLLPPTAMMGATLPLLSIACVGRPQEAAGRVGMLYGINTLGAVAGTLAAGFVLMPALGVRITLLMTALINLGLAAVAWLLDRSWSEIRQDRSEEPIVPRRTAMAPEAGQATRWLPVVVLTALGLSGFTSMVYEVAWTRSLSLVIGSSVYGFTIVLATFLAGIALGSAMISRWVKHLHPWLLWWIAGVQALIAVTAYITTRWIQHLPYYYTLVHHQTDGEPVWLYLSAFLLSALVILPSTLGMGATFPW